MMLEHGDDQYFPVEHRPRSMRWVILAAFAVSAALLCLTACSATQQIGQMTAADGVQAAAMAGVFSKVDPSAAARVPCYAAFGTVGSNAAGASVPGILSTVEGAIELQATIQIPACQVIAGQVLMWIARKAPFGNLLP